MVSGMQRSRFAMLFVLLSVAASAQDSERGRRPSANDQALGVICVSPNSSDLPTKISPGGEYNPATLTLRIDKRDPIRWPHQHLVKIENLSLNQRHLIVLTSDGKQIHSLWFRFSDYKDIKLCISFDGYQGVQLEDRHSALWCRCR
jgi:hypothetical protein